jgi:hypothetical protein
MKPTFPLIAAILTAGFVTTSAMAGPASGNLIVNGDFETLDQAVRDSFSANGFYVIDPNGPYTAQAPGFNFNITYNAIPATFGWSVPENNVDLISNGGYAPFLGRGGDVVLDLVGVGSTGAISQTFTTAADRPHNVVIDFSRNGSLIDPIWAGDVKTADVLVNGTSIGTLNATDAWQTFRGRFTGTGAPTLFTIRQTAGGGWAGVALDNIIVTEVPEPATWMTTIFGFGLMGAMMRNRRRNSALA